MGSTSPCKESALLQGVEAYGPDDSATINPKRISVNMKSVRLSHAIVVIIS
jgi:hypothetical protein